MLNLPEVLAVLAIRELINYLANNQSIHMQLHKQLHTKNQLGTNFKRILHGSQSV